MADMDNESYEEGVRSLLVGGWDHVDSYEEELNAIEAAAESRNDVATLVLIDMMMEKGDVFARRIALIQNRCQLDELIGKLLGLGPHDKLWHILFQIVERDPSFLGRVEDGIADWPDHARPVPRTWWQRMAGEIAGTIFDWRETPVWRERLLMPRAPEASHRAFAG